ncbi:MAG: YheC/YheD family protein [Gemmatimonadota bacterium]|nr:YheC/YheD family protein [Gemmatimonadota bacterium]
MSDRMVIEPTVRATVGILSRRTPGDPNRLFGLPTSYFAECTEAAESVGMRAVVFEADDVDPLNDTVTAAAWSDGRWHERVHMAMPDVIYDRGPMFDPFYTPSLNRTRTRLMDAGIPFINPLELLRFCSDKMRAHRYLSGRGIPIPDTTFADHCSIQTYLDRYDNLFLKPVSGSNGDGIIEVGRASRDMFLLRYKLSRFSVRSVQHLIRTASFLTGNPVTGENTYLVQQGISPELPGARRYHRFDIRAIMQKDEHHEWDLTGIVARVGQTDAPTTNLSTGARAELAEPILDTVYGTSQRQAILSSIRHICLKVCRGLEETVGTFGELGIDIIPDVSGRPRVIEINAKPGRASFKRIAYSEDVTEADRQRFLDIRQRSVSMPFRYAATLVSCAGVAS